MSRHVHLVGSVPLKDRNEVYMALAGSLGALLKRYSDGETGDRCRWMPWQRPVFATCPQLEPSGTSQSVPGQSYEQYCLKRGCSPDSVRFGKLGYLENARESYADFVRLRGAGVIPASARFLVTMPTPTAQLFSFVAPAAQRAIEPAFFQRVLEEVDALSQAIPRQDLTIQWDTVTEILKLSGAPDKQSYFLDREALLDRLVRLTDRVPEPVEVGFHFCYGDSNHKHSFEPPDMRTMVEVANHLQATARRPIGYFHMPVPRERDDDGYFAALTDLRLKRETELYLGLVHHTDGLEGTQRRIAAAGKVRADFGIATECGFGRRRPETVRELLKIHADAARMS